MLKEFKKVCPDCKVYLSGMTIFDCKEKFDQAYEFAKIKDGKYRIVSLNNPDKLIGVGVRKSGKRVMQLVEANSETEAVWYIKHFDGN